MITSSALIKDRNGNGIRDRRPACSALIAFALLAGASAWSGALPGPWVPLFKGVDHSVGTNDPTVAGNFPRLQVAHCVRVDLTDPDVRLFATPPAPNPVAESRETLTATVPGFMRANQVQIACDANYYNASPGGADPTSAGISCEVYGLEICNGTVVSAQTSPDLAGDPRFATLLFGTNNAPFISFLNRPPGTNIAGMFTAVTGYYPIVSNGLNIGAASINAYPDSFIHQVQPRTAFGLSQDYRYLYLMTIDGRQSGYSDGALDTETAYWMIQFGAYNAINMDGGGSTALYRSDTLGNPVPLNHSSYVAAYGRERYIGSHFGLWAKPLPGFINDIEVLPDDTAATVTWTTTSPATSQVRYGLTTNLGLQTALQPQLTTNHAVLLSGLTPDTVYYYSVVSTVSASTYQSSNQFFTTTNYAITNAIFDLTNTWTFTADNLDVVNWTATNYDDSGWWGSGPGLMWVDQRGPNYAGDIPVPLLTEMPLNPGTSYPYPTYYLRTHFSLTNNPAGAALVLEAYLDDGAVLYLNGGEIRRLYMPAYPTPIYNATLASAYACTGDASCPIDLTIPAVSLTNLVQGDNVLAVEVHNYNAQSPDITFGTTLGYTEPYDVSPELNIVSSNGVSTFTWNRGGFALEGANQLNGPWTPVSGPFGPAVSSPFSMTNSGAAQYFRLHK